MLNQTGVDAGSSPASAFLNSDSKHMSIVNVGEIKQLFQVLISVNACAWEHLIHLIASGLKHFQGDLWPLRMAVSNPLIMYPC
ncbi:MAG: hypothetical protein V7707_02515 [Motiliproteus sp.]